ncbi:PHD-type domain-containing protein [Trichonephila inaurata madagascariensis]|uniref:PHD-type domain-containing protein n=1 Tax=Trichonephila inaurata madagascariensis TaxID=2747483 RepID=A0A8X6IA68_9ARAC|nr:PHD-type domain-containing protein [Trichonephila inaurata madagascariensis]
MVPCVIPLTQEGHSTTPDEENEEAVKDKTERYRFKQFFYKKGFPQQASTHNPTGRPFTSTIIQPFSNIDDENDSDDEVPLERIPPTAPASLPAKSLSFTRESEYTPAKELSGFSYTTPEENPSKLTPLDSYSQTSSPKGFISLDSYSDSRKKKQHFYGTPEPEAVPRPVPEGYQGEIRFPPSPTPYSQRSPSHVSRDAGTPPRFHSQYPDTYAPPRSPEYYQNQQLKERYQPAFNQIM